jgi:molecular chaperone GrpE
MFVTRSSDEEDDMNEDIEIIDEDGAPVKAEVGNGSELEALKAEIAELKKEKLYLLADFDNFRKQAIKERSELVKYGSEPILREFLTVLDNLERSAHIDVSPTPETIENYKNGIEMIITQFKKTLERFGVEEVESKGQTFDPLLHEAVSSEENPDLPPNSVTQVLSKAYKLKGKVIRPAQVVVNTSSKKTDKED